MAETASESNVEVRGADSGMGDRGAETPEDGQADSLARCQASCVDGSRCRAQALPGRRTCLFHSADAQAMLRDARRKGGLTRAAALLPVDRGIGELDWSTPAGLVAIMGAAAEKMLGGQLDPSRARALGEMAGKMLAALSGQVMEARIGEVERLLREIEEADRGAD